MKQTLERQMRALAALTLILAGAVTAIAVPAQPLVTVAIVNDGSEPLPTVNTVNGIAFFNGGASISEADYMKSRGTEFPLQFIFSGRGGEFGVADKVSIRNGERELISISDAGPYLMLKVAPGRYTVLATFKGVAEKRIVVVGNGVSRVNWNTLRASDD
jgi:hypothetical protein